MTHKRPHLWPPEYGQEPFYQSARPRSPAYKRRALARTFHPTDQHEFFGIAYQFRLQNPRVGSIVSENQVDAAAQAAFKREPDEDTAHYRAYYRTPRRRSSIPNKPDAHPAAAAALEASIDCLNTQKGDSGGSTTFAGNSTPWYRCRAKVYRTDGLLPALYSRFDE